MISIQATFTGYRGRPCTLFSAYDDESRVLVCSVEAGYQTARREGCVVITNDPDLTRDSLFTDAQLHEAIKAFYALKGGVAADGSSSRLAFTERAARANPDNVIEQDGLDVSGPRYRVAEGATCGQLAALATCRYALNASTIERSVKMQQSMAELLRRGRIITI